MGDFFASRDFYTRLQLDCSTCGLLAGSCLKDSLNWLTRRGRYHANRHKHTVAIRMITIVTEIEPTPKEKKL